MDFKGIRKDKLLFSEAASRAVVSLEQQKLSYLQEISAQYGIEVNVLGTVGGDDMIFSDKGSQFINLPVDIVTRTWEEAIECHMK